ncbi:polysaccharide deacetylase family protein [Bacillus sp. FJAT-47783]|uniref:polysaccharide deacetylase family protein n=1 Tax=Bacillus sp. FJAT-47783 TaxID=2922712 RepID=UPI001FAB5949|nr:polysaccharide deacetylase family protein [Bacillus sp. FJAT-47783]
MQGRNRSENRKRKSKKRLYFFSISIGLIVLLSSMKAYSIHSEEAQKAERKEEISNSETVAQDENQFKGDGGEDQKAEGNEVAEQKNAKKTMENSNNTNSTNEPTTNVTEKTSTEENQNKKQDEKEMEKVIYLTFDDGPFPVSEEILNVLAKHNAKATYFLLEPNMRKYPDIVKRMKEDGHALGLHGVTHDKRKFYRSAKSVLTEMDKAKETLEELTGVTSSLIRTPYGTYPNMKKEYFQAAEKNGYKVWDWNVDSRDWKYRDKRYVKDAISQIEALESQNKSPVVLLHEKVETAKYLDLFLTKLDEKGYTYKTLNEDMTPIHF